MIERGKPAETDVERILSDLTRLLGIGNECFEIHPIALTGWPEKFAIYFALRIDRHGRYGYHYVCYDGEFYSPLTPDSLDRLLHRLVNAQNFSLDAERLVNLLLMFERPEPFMSLITNFARDLSAENREILTTYYELTDISPEMEELEEGGYKLVFWTFNLRIEMLKRWLVHIDTNGRTNFTSDVELPMKELREEAAQLSDN